MNDVQALVIPANPDTSVQVCRVAPTFTKFCSLVDDVNTDTLFLTEVNGVVKIAANGKSSDTHDPNLRATQLVERFLPGFAARDRIEGAALFVGLTDDGDTCDVPSAVMKVAQNLFGVDNNAH